MKKNTKGFTLIELLVVIAIIGLLSTLAVVSLNNAREKARNAKRLSDVKQVQTALELYFTDENRYPGTADLVLSASTRIAGANVTYMASTPVNPRPIDVSDANCTGTTDYAYASVGTFNSYTITYCISQGAGDVTAGNHCATPAGITDDTAVASGC